MAQDMSHSIVGKEQEEGKVVISGELQKPDQPWLQRISNRFENTNPSYEHEITNKYVNSEFEVVRVEGNHIIVDLEDCLRYNFLNHIIGSTFGGTSANCGRCNARHGCVGHRDDVGNIFGSY